MLLSHHTKSPSPVRQPLRRSTLQRHARAAWLAGALGSASLYAADPSPTASPERAAASPTPSPTPDDITKSGIRYAEASGKRLLLDIYLPKNVEKPPLVVFIHGGGWRKGGRLQNPVRWLTESGYALASIDYRLSNVATFPAQIYDCKGAIRWLRAQADKYGYDASRVAVIGASAGGHLAVLLGTSGDAKELEGDTGGNLDQSSRVQAIVDFFGPTDFTLWSQELPRMTEEKEGVGYLLLGGPLHEKAELGRLASGVTWVTPDDPPLIIFHGSADTVVPVSQARRITEAYRKQGLEVSLNVMEGANHSRPANPVPADYKKQIIDFLNRHLRGAG